MLVRARRRFSALDVAILGASAPAAALRELVCSGGTARAVTLCADIEAIQTHLANADCDVIAVVLCDAAGIDAIKRLRAARPDVAVVALVVHEDGARLHELALDRGAHDCLVLDGLDATLLAYALRHAALDMRRRRERRAHAAELRALFDLGAHPMWVCDPVSLALLGANRAAVNGYGYGEGEFHSMSLADLRGPAPAAPGANAGAPVPGATVIEQHRRKDGSLVEVELFAQSVPLWGRATLLLQARDVTVERRAMRALEASERRFRDFFEHSTGFICIHDLDGTLLSVNPAAAAALGRSIAELLGTPLRDLSAPELRFLTDNYLQRIAQNGEDAGVLHVLDGNGTELVWQYRNRVYTDADGASYVMAYAQDITAMRAVEKAFRLSERRLRTIADTLPLRIAYVDAQQRLAFANEAYRLTYSPDGSEIDGRSVRDLLGERRYAQRQPFLERALRGEHVVFEDEEGEGPDYVCVEITFIPELPENGTAVIGVHVMMQDITAKKREEQRLTRLARIDDLTGLLNRASFYERMHHAVARARDQDSLLAVFYLDIDHFKQVNDTYGHAAGDALISAFAMRLADKVRASDVVARLGGDEFAVLMEGARDADHIRSIAAQLIASLQRPFELRETKLTLSVGTSIGVALCRGGPLASAELVARADAMLYEAKQAGRGTFRLTTIGVADIAGLKHQL